MTGRTITAPGSGHLSNSQLTSFADCGEKYRLAYIERYPKRPSGPLIAGIAIHDTIETAYRSGWMAEPYEHQADIVGHYKAGLEAAVREAGGPDAIRWAGRKSKAWPGGEDYEWWMSPAAEDMLKRSADLATEDAAEGTVTWRTDSDEQAGIELKIDIPFGEARTITARIDHLLVDGNGEVVVRDYTTGKPGGKTPLQGALYAIALERADGFGFEVSRVQYAYLRGATRELMIQEFDPRPLAESVLRNFEALARGIEAEAFVMKPGPFCKSCDVRSGCAYGATLPE